MAKRPINKLHEIFGENLLRARQEAGLTQQDLADAVDMSRVQICNIEVGNCGTGIETLMKICAVMKCTPNDLLPPVPKMTKEEVKVEKNIFKW